jgi:hypothetical protein
VWAALGLGVGTVLVALPCRAPRRPTGEPAEGAQAQASGALEEAV